MLFRSEMTDLGLGQVTEHRVFELEDERKIELLSVLSLSHTYCDSHPLRDNMRQAYRNVPSTLPHYKHDLRQLGVDKAKLTSLIQLLTRILPDRPGLCLSPERAGRSNDHIGWCEFLSACDNDVLWSDFDELLHTHVVSAIPIPLTAGSLS